MPQFYTAGQLASIIRKLAEMDIEDLGPDENSQNTYIFYYINIAMWHLARLANQVRYSDQLYIESDGYVTFQHSGQPITDMFEPLMILDPDGKPVQKRTADDAPKGWWREAENQEIHIRGFSLTAQPLAPGNYQLKYIKYPRPVTVKSDPLEFPPSGYNALIKEVLSLIKYSGNEFADAEYLDTKAKQAYGTLAQAAMSARGTGTTGQPISDTDVNRARGL